jgi:hypothetical protein
VYIEVRDAETPFSRCWCIPLEVVSCCYMSKHDDNMMCWTKLFCVLRLIGLADTIRIVDVNYLRCHGSTHIWQSKHHLKPILHLSLPHPLYLHSPPPMPHNPSITSQKCVGMRELIIDLTKRPSRKRPENDKNTIQDGQLCQNEDLTTQQCLP